MNLLHNPLKLDSYDRFNLINHFPYLKCLNYTKIKQKERNEAELIIKNDKSYKNIENKKLTKIYNIKDLKSNEIILLKK